MRIIKENYFFLFIFFGALFFIFLWPHFDVTRLFILVIIELSITPGCFTYAAHLKEGHLPIGRIL